MSKSSPGCLGWAIAAPILFLLSFFIAKESDTARYLFGVGLTSYDKSLMSAKELRRIKIARQACGCVTGCGCLILLIFSVLVIWFIIDCFDGWLST